MKRTRRNHGVTFKAQVALAAAKGDKTLAEVASPLDGLLNYLPAAQVRADLTQNFSGSSVVAMPPGYKDRAIDLLNEPGLHIHVLSPINFILAKLRRGTDVTLENALLVAQRYRIAADALRATAQAALAASPQGPVSFSQDRGSLLPEPSPHSRIIAHSTRSLRQTT